MRPKQWTKNLLLFAGVVFAHVAGNFTDDLKATAGFVIFCGLAGGQYVLNDVADLEADRLHPRKRLRPIASGRVPPRTATIFGISPPAASPAGALRLPGWVLVYA